MSPEKWSRVKELLNAFPANRESIGEIPNLEREDDEVRTEVQRLLSEYQNALKLSADSDEARGREAWFEELALHAGGETRTLASTPREFGSGRGIIFAPGECVLEQFRILRLLGRGGMGEVYEAEDSELGKIAIKTIHPKLAGNAEILHRFRQEAQLARRVSSPYVCRIHELHTLRGALSAQAFLTMEFLEGFTLADEIERLGALPFPDAERIAQQLCEGLHAIHQAGVIHRDFKSRNIMLVTRYGKQQAVVMDLGLARETVPEQHGITVTGMVMGTPEYMAPEQFTGHNVGPSADIYALGIVLYELVTGIRPFRATSALEAAVLRAKRPAAASTVRDGIPKVWDKVIDRCLEFEPQKRWMSVEEVAKALRAKESEPLRGIGARFSILLAVMTVVLTLICSGAIWVNGRITGASHVKPQQLVVLPFENIGGNAGNQAVCDGLLEILTSAVSETSALRQSFLVIPATEVRRERVKGIQEARRIFNATLALTGSVMPSGDAIEVTVSLSDVYSRRQVASRHIRSQQADSEGLERKLLSAVMEVLQLEMQPEAKKIIASGTHNSEAFDLYLKGQGSLRRFQGPPAVEAAIGLLEHAVRLDPSFAQARSTLAGAYFNFFQQTKDPKWLARADEESNAAAELNNSLPEVHATLGLIARGTGRYDVAKSEFSQAITLNPADYESQRALAKTLEAMGKPDEAETVYLNAIRAKPSYWPTGRSLGVFYLLRGEYSKAEPWLKLVTELVPENASGFLNLGLLYYSTGRYPEAESAYRKSIVLQPLPEAYLNLGTDQFFQKNYTAASESFEKAIQLAPKDSNNWGGLADSYSQIPARRAESKRTYQKAVDLARQQIAINPNDADLRSRLALYLAKVGSIKESLAEITVALKSSNEMINIPFNAAQVYEIAGDRTSAIRYLKEALERRYSPDEALGIPEFAELRKNPELLQLILQHKK